MTKLSYQDVTGFVASWKVHTSQLLLTDTSPKTGLNPSPWAESGLGFNFLASFTAKNCTCISPSTPNARPSLLPGYRICDGFAYRKLHSISTYIIWLNEIIRLTQIQTAVFFPNH